MARPGYVYILASKSRHLYIGMTTNPVRRWLQHRTGVGSRQSREFRVFHLVWIETCPTPRAAIEREKQLKGWRRSRKLALIAEFNPQWRDLAVQWGWHRLVDSFREARHRQILSP